MEILISSSIKFSVNEVDSRLQNECSLTHNSAVGNLK